MCVLYLYLYILLQLKRKYKYYTIFIIHIYNTFSRETSRSEMNLFSILFIPWQVEHFKSLLSRCLRKQKEGKKMNQIAISSYAKDVAGH